jgi:hypothetical protein
MNFGKDPSGKFKKYIYLVEQHPDFVKQVIEWSKHHNLFNLPFDEILYLYANNLNEAPSKNGKFKEFRGWNKGYSVNGKFKRIEDKFVVSSLEEFKKELTEKDYEKQAKGGFISQRLMNNHVLIDKIHEKYSIDIPIRQKINLFLYDLEEIPKCKVCNAETKPRLTHKLFRETCSEKCRRIRESSYKKHYKIQIGNKQINVAGYERFVIPELLKKYQREDMLIGFEIEPIKYEFEGKSKKYYPDIFIISENKIIEVKSSYTFEADKDKNLAKQKACIEQGYDFEFHIWDLKEIIK